MSIGQKQHYQSDPLRARPSTCHPELTSIVPPEFLPLPPEERLSESNNGHTFVTQSTFVPTEAQIRLVATLEQENGTGEDPLGIDQLCDKACVSASSCHLWLQDPEFHAWFVDRAFTFIARITPWVLIRIGNMAVNGNTDMMNAVFCLSFGRTPGECAHQVDQRCLTMANTSSRKPRREKNRDQISTPVEDQDAAVPRAATSLEGQLSAEETEAILRAQPESSRTVPEFVFDISERRRKAG